MKRLFIVITIILIIALPLVAADSIRPNGIGAGLYLGYPSGVTVRYGMDDFRFFANVTSLFKAGFNLDVGALYDIYPFDVGGGPLYINAGVQVGLSYYTDDKFSLSTDGVVGASYYFADFPLELFLDVALGYKFLGAAGFDYKAGLGGVWYF